MIDVIVVVIYLFFSFSLNVVKFLAYFDNGKAGLRRIVCLSFTIFGGTLANFPIQRSFLVNDAAERANESPRRCR